MVKNALDVYKRQLAGFDLLRVQPLPSRLSRRFDSGTTLWLRQEKIPLLPLAARGVLADRKTERIEAACPGTVRIDGAALFAQKLADPGRAVWAQEKRWDGGLFINTDLCVLPQEVARSHCEALLQAQHIVGSKTNRAPAALARALWRRLTGEREGIIRCQPFRLGRRTGICFVSWCGRITLRWRPTIQASWKRILHRAVFTFPWQ